MYKNEDHVTAGSAKPTVSRIVQAATLGLLMEHHHWQNLESQS